MGHFSNLTVEYIPYERDHSYTPPETQLLWRLEELEDRLQELLTRKTGWRDDGICFSGDDLRYVLPKQFLSVSDVRSAIKLAVRDLAERYGIYVRGNRPEETPEVDEVTEMQISILDLLSVQAFRIRAAAA